MPSFITPPRFGFDAAPTVAPTPTWGFGLRQQDENGSPTSALSTTSPGSSFFGSSSVPLDSKFSSSTVSPPVQMQPAVSAVSAPTGLLFAAVSTDATGKQTTKRISNPASILSGDIHIVRVYLSLEDLPPKAVHGMFLHFQKDGTNPLQEVHLCIRSLLRPCLQDIEEDATLQQKMLHMISQWVSFGTVVKFFFHRPGIGVDRDRFQNFVEKDLVRAIEGLREHDVELSEILGEESWVYGRGAAEAAELPGARGVAGDDLVDEMI